MPATDNRLPAEQPTRKFPRWLKRTLATLTALLLLVGSAFWWLPPLLDDVYYQGPVSDHFDGERFFNPDGVFGPPKTSTPMLFIRFFLGEGQTPWPDQVAVTPTKPDGRIEGDAMRVTWVGHSTVLVQTQGLNILTDPIWSERASPFGFIGPKRARAPGVAFDDLPKIDLVLISHNHYDHMDISTLKRLKERDNPLIVTSLGNDEILRRHGLFARAGDWGDRFVVRPGIDVIVERVHHWGSRWGADRNRALWSGFTVTLPGGNLYFAGDTGFGNGSWADEAAKRGPVRLAIIPVGAFLPRDIMTDNHASPLEAIEAFNRLGARQALAVHWGTIQLSHEGIDVPRQSLTAELRKAAIPENRFRALEAGQVWDID